MMMVSKKGFEMENKSPIENAQRRLLEKNIFRLLKADEIEVRVNQVSEKYTQLLLYKTARVDANILDETLTPIMWQGDYKAVGTEIYAGIGIRAGNEWVWKWDTGSAGNFEPEKSIASDSFKRAGFKWGIGRELYTAPKIAVVNDAIGGVTCRDSGGRKFWNLNKPFQTFAVKEIEYNDQREITKLTIVDGRGNVIWSNKH